MTRILLSVFVALSLLHVTVGECFSTSHQNLIGYWKSNGDARDHSGNGHHAECYKPGSKREKTECVYSAGVPGDKNKAFLLDGGDKTVGGGKSPANTLVQVESSAFDFKTQDSFTLMQWFYPQRFFRWQPLIMKGYWEWEYGLVLFEDQIQTGYHNRNLNYDGIKVPLNEWTHVAQVYSNGKSTLYVNGVERGTKSHNVGPANPQGKGHGIGIGVKGIHEGDVYFKGLMDDTAIFNTALTGQDISQIYHAGFCPCDGVRNNNHAPKGRSYEVSEDSVEDEEEEDAFRGLRAI